MVCPVPRSGRLGFVGDYTGDTLTRFSRVRNWTFNAIGNPETRVYSGTRFGTQRIAGFTDYRGTFQGFGAIPPLFVGEVFTFLGYTAPTSGVPCSPGYAFVAEALVDTLSISWNWTQENRGVNWQIGFSSKEPFEAISNFDDPCDDEVYCDDNPCELTFELLDPCDGDAAVEFCNLVSATLNFTANNIAYSNNSTGCVIARDIGNLDWTLDVVDQNPFIVPTLNYDYFIRIQATINPDPTYWLLKWGQMIGVADFNVNMETGEIISKTNNFGMQAVLCCEGESPVRGSITSPLDTVVWPFSSGS